MAADTTQQRADVTAVESYDWRIERVTLPDGRSGVVCYFYDMTESRRATTLLRAISDHTSDVIFAKDIDGRVTFANPATLALAGKSAEQVLGKTDAEFLEDEEAARLVMENDRRIMTTGIAEELEESVPLPDGTPRIWFSQKFPYLGPGGQIIGLLGVSRDITERNAAETALRARERELRTVLDLLPVGVFISDRIGSIVQTNRAADEIWGKDRPATLGARDYAAYRGWFVANGKQVTADEWAAARVLATGLPVLDQEVEIETFTGERKTILNSAVPLRGDDGTLIGSVTINVDITDRGGRRTGREARICWPHGRDNGA